MRMCFWQFKSGTNRTTKIPILTYHDVQSSLPPNDPFEYAYITTPKNFEENITTILDHGFEAISLTQLYNFVINKEKLPKRPIIITFDDGYEGQYTLAYPIIKKLKVKATLFVVTDWVGTIIDEATYFNWDEAKIMEESGLIDICSHSKRHIASDTMSTDELKEDIKESFDVLDERLGKRPLKIFAYPYGLYNQSTIQALSQIGVDIQATGLGLDTLKNIDLSNLPRLSVSNFTTGKEIVNKINLNTDLH